MPQFGLLFLLVFLPIRMLSYRRLFGLTGMRVGLAGRPRAENDSDTGRPKGRLVSGGKMPLESEPRVLQIVMQGVASTHFVSFAEAILFRGAGLALVYRDYLAVTGLGAVFFTLSVSRFRRSAGGGSGMASLGNATRFDRIRPGLGRGHLRSFRPCHAASPSRYRSASAQSAPASAHPAAP